MRALPRLDRWLLWAALAVGLVFAFKDTPAGQAVTNRIVYLAAGDGTKITATAEGAFVPIDVALIDPTTNAKVLYTNDPTHDNTVGTQGPQQMLVAGAAAPTNVTDGRAVRQWGLQNGAAVINPSYAGVLASTGVGVAGTGTPRTTDVASGTIGAAPPAQASYLGLNTSGATAGLLGGAIGCDSQAFLDMTTATTTELVSLTSGRKIYVCYWLALSNGSTTMTFKRGTGANCGTGTTTISNAWELTAQVGFSGGTGAFPIFDNLNAGDALCTTNSSAVNLHVYVRYAKL